MAGVIDHVNLDILIDAQLNNSLDGRLAFDPIRIAKAFRLGNGTSTGLASQMWYDTRTLVASATENLDFAGVLTNAFGVTLTFTRIKLLYVEASSANTNDVQVQRHTSAGVPIFMAALDGIALGPGEGFLYFAPVGKTVTATTADMLTITNSAGSTGVDYSILAIGTD